MPTEIINTIAATSSPITPDYTSLQAWEDDCPVDLVAADQIWIGECLNQGVLGYVNIGGITADETRHPVIQCAAGHSFRENDLVRESELTAWAGTNPEDRGVTIRVAGTNNYFSHSIYCSVRNTEFHDLQIINTSNRGLGVRLATGQYPDKSPLFNSCLVDAPTCIGRYENTFERGSCILINCVFYSNSTSTLGRGTIYFWGNDEIVEAYGCTFINDGDSPAPLHAASGGGQGLAWNCLFLGYALISSRGTYINCGADVAIPNSTNGLESLVASDEIENPLSPYDARLKETATAIGMGVVNGNMPHDVSGSKRQNPPSIGAWDFPATALLEHRSIGSQSRFAKRFNGRQP